jgi:hypothetical protein
MLLMSIFFDPEDNFEAYRRNLPHRRQAGVIYFVTFHLADSLPTKKLVAWEKERKLWLALNPPPHNSRQIEEYHRNFSQRIQKWLDVGYGSCALACPKTFRLVESVLNFFTGQRYVLGEHVVMPNHLHALVQPLDDHSRNHPSFMEVVFGEPDRQNVRRARSRVASGIL